MIITKENIEAVLYDYAEGNLSAQEVKEADKYLSLHPEYKEMLNLYDPALTIEEPSDIVYGDKEELFNAATGSQSKKIILISRYVKWISGAAAMIVLLLAIKGVYNLSYQSVEGVDEGKEIAANLTEAKNQTEDVYTDTKNEDCNLLTKAKETYAAIDKPIQTKSQSATAIPENDAANATEDNTSDIAVKTNTSMQQIPDNTDIAMQNSVTYIQEVDELPGDMDTIKIIYVKSEQPKHNNPFINYVNRKTGGMIDKAKERIAYKF
ncbi:MAG: hypothetical protein J6P44_08490 [Bacteroidales bacterium]|nr:hypothetical protein [Bacteroidales bacterium]